MNLSPALCKAVELCSNHLRKEDVRLLQTIAAEHRGSFSESAEFQPVVFETRYGFLIAIGELTVNAIVARGASSEFKSLLEWCLEPSQGILYLAFDADAAQIEDLPMFDW
jgi:hypothetical protein